jgi:proline dehydrogenase
MPFGTFSFSICASPPPLSFSESLLDATMYRNTADKVCRKVAASTSKKPIRISQPTSTCRSRPSSTYTFNSASSHESAQSSTRSKALRYAGAGALALGSGAYFVSSLNKDSPPLLSPPSFNSNDPLSALDPSALARTTAHLTGQALGDLCRQWLVFAISEQSLIVQAGPWMLGKIEWTRDHVPILGSAVWAVFAFVSLSSSHPSRIFPFFLVPHTHSLGVRRE